MTTSSTLATRIPAPGRRGAVVLAALTLAVAAVTLALPAPAADAASYRFWSYWTGSGDGWEFATVGASRRPPDGSVDGWRFAVSPATGSTQSPRANPSFEAICGETLPVEGQKRVAVVVDFGTTTDAPDGERPPQGPFAFCARVPTAANGYEVLTSRAPLRTESGLVCAIFGYPSQGCGEAVRPTTSSKPAPSPTKTPGAASTTSTGSGSGAGPGTSSAPPQPSDGADRTVDAAKNAKQGKQGKPTAAAAPTEPAPGVGLSTAAPGDLPAPQAAAAGTDSGSGSPVGLLVVATLLAALGAGVALARRRRS